MRFIVEEVIDSIGYVPYDDGGPSEEGGRTTVWVTVESVSFPLKVV